MRIGWPICSLTFWLTMRARHQQANRPIGELGLSQGVA
jgi:hypothetical protein